jgi:hypothetical protein
MGGGLVRAHRREG